MAKNIIYSEPADYFPEDIRKIFLNDEKEEDGKKVKKRYEVKVKKSENK